jgi:hypothetical protein
VPPDRCYDFKNIFAEKFSEKMAFSTQNKAKLCKILIITLVFEKNANFFVENRKKSQNPDWTNFRLLGDYLLWADF